MPRSPIVLNRIYCRQLFSSLAASAVIAVSLNACMMVGPDFIEPVADANDEWVQSLKEGLDTTTGPVAEWWMVFDDPVLNKFVVLAKKGNNNLQVAGLRVLEAMAQLGIATGAQYPQGQFLQGDAAYVSPPDTNRLAQSGWTYGASANVAWEIDFWGKFRRGIEAADASFFASVAAYDQTDVLLIAAVVDVYSIIRTTEEQLRVSQENVVIQQRSFEIASVLFKNGSDSELDVQQASTLLLGTKATIPSLQIALVQSRNALSTLLGLPPGTVKNLLVDAVGIPVIPGKTSVGAPADMLRRRPDVRQAEFLALRQNELVGVAKADLYPSFSLFGSIGVSTGNPGDADFGDLFESDAVTYSYGPSMTWPFLNYGRIKNNIRVQDVRLQEALINYKETVLQAAREAEDAMAGFVGAREQAAILSEAVESAKRSNELSTLRYREGFSSYQRVLESQQALFSQQQGYITSRGDTVRNLVSLYKALGGGWEALPGEAIINADTIETMRARVDWGDLLEPEELNRTIGESKD
jgi:NodT family efflux transporter outer membrane factor (OMF) lipoprotein